MEVVKPQPGVDPEVFLGAVLFAIVQRFGAEMIDLGEIRFRDFEFSACSIEFAFRF